jgi:hypothetical protein
VRVLVLAVQNCMGSHSQWYRCSIHRFFHLLHQRKDFSHHEEGPQELSTHSQRKTCVKHHTATVTPPLHLQQPAPKPSIFPSDSDSQHSFTYLWKFSESSTLISLISVAKSEFSRVLAYPTTRNATQTSPTPRPTTQTSWECVPSSCGPSERWKQPFP